MILVRAQEWVEDRSDETGDKPKFGSDKYFTRCDWDHCDRRATVGCLQCSRKRVLYVDPPGTDRKVVVDFNKAHNPPCAFTKFPTVSLSAAA